jgi:hypothetical protein
MLLCLLSLAALWLSAQVGVFVRKHARAMDEDDRSDFTTVVAATLTLLGLIIGFSFSMAIGRYDQRKNLEAEEANAIGTEYVRSDLLPVAEAEKVHAFLKEYVHQRILFYETTNLREQEIQIDRDTTQLERELWSTVKNAAARQPTPTLAVVVVGMNDVLNARGYTQAAWWNRIPVAAWALMITIAIFSNFLIGYETHHARVLLFLILPLAISVAFLLIADIDSPHGGLIRVLPQNLVALSQSLQQ